MKIFKIAIILAVISLSISIQAQEVVSSFYNENGDHVVCVLSESEGTGAPADSSESEGTGLPSASSESEGTGLASESEGTGYKVICSVN